MMPRITLCAILFILVSVLPISAQTCSCAGAPLLSSQSTGASSAGGLLFGITYEYHDISAMYAGSRKLDDETVSRATRSALLELHYGITDRLSLSTTFSYVSKDRKTGLHTPSGGTRVNTNGLGDGMVLVRYVLLQQNLWQRYHFALGGGTKVPFGTTSLTRNGFAMNADMQPGTGAWDGVLWSHLSAGFLPWSTLNLSLTTSYRHTGANDRFGAGDSYRFGNELVSNLGASNRLLDNLSYMISLRYRSTSSDKLNENRMPNTGGWWLTLVPNFDYALSERVSVRLSGQLPIYQELNGTQPSTSYAISGSLFIGLFNQTRSGFNYGKPQ